MVLFFFAFLGGIVTILSPCILPILPIVLSSSFVGGKRRPLGVVTGFVISFTFFTLFLTVLVRALGFDANILRTLAAAVVLVFGLVMIVPALGQWWERMTSRFISAGAGAGSSANASGVGSKSGFLGGVVIGLSLGLIWAPCVGPIMAAIIALVATSTVGWAAFWVVFAYSLGTAIPMLFIAYGGRRVLATMPFLRSNSRSIQKIFGVVMVVTAAIIYLGLDIRFQAMILKTFPNYGAGLTSLEDNQLVKKELESLNETSGGQRSGALLQNLQTMVGELPDYGQAPELLGGTGWVNSDPLTLEGLRGRVVLIDFWTYSCINCIRTLPFLTAWYEKYSDDGFVIIGVHSPEFEFEKKTDNVRKAMADFGVVYPVIQDNDFAIWKAYDNRYWPAKYLIDKNGRVRYIHFGEGKYEETEKAIQKLLAETGVDAGSELVDREEFVQKTKTPETYLGYLRMKGIVPAGDVVEDEEVDYSFPSSLRTNQFALDGNWIIRAEHSEALPLTLTGAESEMKSRIRIRFNAKDVHLVANPGSVNEVSKMRVYLDGQLITSSDAGGSVVNGLVEVDSDKLYTLVELDDPGDHLLELEILDEGLQLFAFTFG